MAENPFPLNPEAAVRPLVVISVWGGYAEVAFTDSGQGFPEVHIVDLDDMRMGDACQLPPEILARLPSSQEGQHLLTLIQESTRPRKPQ